MMQELTKANRIKELCTMIDYSNNRADGIRILSRIGILAAKAGTEAKDMETAAMFDSLADLAILADIELAADHQDIKRNLEALSATVQGQ